MKPAAFDYYQPSNLEEALQLLNEYGDEGKIIAGGQSFVPILNMRLSTPECLIDINRIKELDYIKLDGNLLKLGGLTRQRELEHSAIIRDEIPLLAEAARFIGHTQTRNRGTIGGSLVHADPSGELPLSLLTLGAKAVVKSIDEERIIDLSEFFLTYLTVNMMPNELLTEIQIPFDHSFKGYAFVEFSRKHGDFAIVAVACLLNIDDKQQITDGRLAIGGIHATPILLEDAFHILKGSKLSDDLFEDISALVYEHADPDDDLHASKEYRIHLAQVLTKRSIVMAYNRALGKGDSL